MANVKELKKVEKVVKEWKPNPNQEKVLKALEDYKEGAMLVDIEIDKGFKVATGVITPLVNKGLVVATEVDRVSDIVYRETVIGHKTDHVKKYMLAKYVGLVEEKENVEENVNGVIAE